MCVSEESLLSVAGLTVPAYLSSSFSNGEEKHISYLSDLVQQLEVSSGKDLRVAHLNECALRNTMQELRCLQLLCSFDVLLITETHLDKTVLDNVVEVDGMKFLWLDRKGCNGGRGV